MLIFVKVVVVDDADVVAVNVADVFVVVDVVVAVVVVGLVVCWSCRCR